MTPAVTPAFVKVGRKAYPFTSYKDASAAYMQTCVALDVGSSRAPNCLLLDANMRPIGSISYNGKAWLRDARDVIALANEVCVYNPYLED